MGVHRALRGLALAGGNLEPIAHPDAGDAEDAVDPADVALDRRLEPVRSRGNLAHSSAPARVPSSDPPTAATL
jgi:hypothetical protein